MEVKRGDREEKNVWAAHFSSEELSRFEWGFRHVTAPNRIKDWKPTRNMFDP